MKLERGARAQFVSAKEAAEALGVTLPTLYAYVSRGMVRSVDDSSAKRTRKYAWDDIQRLARRQRLKRNPLQTSEDALEFGSPVVASALTRIDGGRLYYRGFDAIDLSRSAGAEQVAALLWTGDLEGVGELFSLRDDQPRSAREERVLDALAECDPMTKMSALMAIGADENPSAFDLRIESLLRNGIGILDSFRRVVGRGDRSIAESIAEAWAGGDATACRAIDAALVVCADHELNVSAFAARCAASAGATLFASVCAGLAALSGPRHGGTTRRVQALFADVVTPERAESELAERLRRDEPLPGFGHRLYPDGDPRCVRLMEVAAGGPDAEEVLPTADAIVRAGEKLLRVAPNLDFGLVALSAAYGFPRHAPMSLFAMGRTIGWIAHAIEEHDRGSLIRPRARYTGPVFG